MTEPTGEQLAKELGANTEVQTFGEYLYALRELEARPPRSRKYGPYMLVYPITILELAVT